MRSLTKIVAFSFVYSRKSCFSLRLFWTTECVSFWAAFLNFNSVLFIKRFVLVFLSVFAILNKKMLLVTFFLPFFEKKIALFKAEFTYCWVVLNSNYVVVCLEDSPTLQLVSTHKLLKKSFFFLLSKNYITNKSVLNFIVFSLLCLFHSFFFFRNDSFFLPLLTPLSLNLSFLVFVCFIQFLLFCFY